MKFRPATVEDAGHFVRVFEEASHGLSSYLWQKSAGQQGNVKQVALDSMTRKLTTAKPDTIYVAEVDGQVAGGVITNAIGDRPEDIGADCDPAVVTLIKLENQALNTHYINALAVFPEFQGRGIGTALLRETGRRFPKSDLSLIVVDINQSARRLYERVGFLVSASEPLGKSDWKTDIQSCILMKREAQANRS